MPIIKWTPVHPKYSMSQIIILKTNINELSYEFGSSVKFYKSNEKHTTLVC